MYLGAEHTIYSPPVQVAAARTENSGMDTLFKHTTRLGTAPELRDQG